MIQHSFALRLDATHSSFRGPTSADQLARGFGLPPVGGPEFKPEPVGVPADDGDVAKVARHSPLTQHALTDAWPVRLPLLERRANGAFREALPSVLSWAKGPGQDEAIDGEEEARFTFSGPRAGAGRPASANDFLVVENGCSEPEGQVGPALLQLIAHRRARLFGLALAKRFVNVMLPQALLIPTPEAKARSADAGALILQPLVTFIRDGRRRACFGRTYALTLLLVPVDERGEDKRPMSQSEISHTVNAGWGLSTSPPSDALPVFDVSGPLGGYLTRLAGDDRLVGLLRPPDSETAAGKQQARRCPPVTLRQAAEALAFCAGLRLARGDGREVGPTIAPRIGNDVVAALGSCRVSSVVVVDRKLKKKDVERPECSGSGPPGRLPDLMAEVAVEYRSPRVWTGAEQRRYRLDRPFADSPCYAVGVLPRNRCLIVTSAADAQRGRAESGLMQAASVVYMTVGAATAIGTMRAIDHDLEQMKDEDPREIAKIDGEIAADLNEIYDLDITREAYRHLYRRLRNRLGITRDYMTLQDKMKTLYRATSTNHDAKAQTQLARLTAAIVVLSVLILVVTLVKP